jgi:2-polyprenyl-3-methyl-5-hydroxy-6-metoxy-1,4-benzoquinol methylase
LLPDMSDKLPQSYPDRAAVERSVQSCYATWAQTYFEQYYRAAGAYPPVHQAIVRDLLVAAGARRLIDAGCGPASMLRTLADLGIALYGFDLTAEMVAEARRVMSALGIPADHFWQASVLDAGAYAAPDGQPFDAAICIGVLPHVRPEDDATVLARLREAVRPGALVIVEARNQLFGLFTLNRYSRDFFRDELIRPETFAGEAANGLDAALSELDRRFRVDLPPVRRGVEGEPGYDEVLSRTHNPLVLRDIMTGAGYRDVELLFYHYHALPPMLEHHLPEAFRARSLGLENPRDWRGHFMASAFLLAGRRG